jgi:hypothetical protein
MRARMHVCVLCVCVYVYVRLCFVCMWFVYFHTYWYTHVTHSYFHVLPLSSLLMDWCVVFVVDVCMCSDYVCVSVTPFTGHYVLPPSSNEWEG